jgi:biotin carboxyl carrier protein
MKLKVRVDGQEFEVEVGDLAGRPVVAVVDGQRFEVWPEEKTGVTSAVSPVTAKAVPTSSPPRRSRRSSGQASAPAGSRGRAVYAPLPGVVDSLAVGAGESVTAGQALCVIEAMKMKNIIRAPRAGEIEAVHVAVGQHVKHNDLLVEYRA